MGVTVRQKIKGSGIYWIFINHCGVRRSKMVGTFKAAKHAAEVLQAKLKLKELNVADLRDEITFVTFQIFAMTWLSTYVKGVLDDSTHERYEAVLKKDILPALGRLPLDAIEPKHVRNMLNQLTRDGRTSKSIALTRTVLSSCLSEAVVEGHIKNNPVTVVMQNRKRCKTTEARRPKIHRANPLTKEEVARFLQTVFKLSPTEYWPLFLCAFRTGLRLGELISIHWSDIDWEAGTIHVQRSYNRKKIKPTKAGMNQRVNLSDQLLRVLKGMYEARNHQDGNWRPSDIIFHHNGDYRAQNTVRKAFKTFLKKADIREIRVHDIRHTFASILISNGASLAYIRDQLGHSSIKTTGDIYAHLLPNSMREFTNILDEPETNRTPTPRHLNLITCTGTLPVHVYRRS